MHALHSPRKGFSFFSFFTIGLINGRRVGNCTPFLGSAFAPPYNDNFPYISPILMRYLKPDIVLHYYRSTKHLSRHRFQSLSIPTLSNLLWQLKRIMSPHVVEVRAVSTATKSRFHAQSTKSAIQLESERIADIYAPIPTVFARAEGAHVWDPEGNQYLDFLSAYSVTNQGHCHPALVKALTEQAGRLSICSRAFYSDVLPKWAEKVTDVFGYEKVLPMCTGAEAVETAVKLARKWAYKTKKVLQDDAWVFGAQGNFHGRTVSTLHACARIMRLTKLTRLSQSPSRLTRTRRETMDLFSHTSPHTTPIPESLSDTAISLT